MIWGSFGGVTAISAKAVVPGEYERECQWRRRTHNICEGDSVTIQTAHGFTGSTVDCLVQCIVKKVHQHFIVLRFPAGFLVSFRWREFEQMRLKEE